MRIPLVICAVLGITLFPHAGMLLGDPGKETKTESIARLIRQLGDEVFAKREAATKELDAIGEPALDSLRKAASDDDAEVRQRAELLIASITGRVRAAITRNELEKLQGAWTLVSYETDGKQIKGEDKSHTFTVKGEKWSIHVSGQVFQAGTVQRIDVMEKINCIDLLIADGGNVGATAASIYSIEGDTLKYLNCGDPRPAEFVTKEGDGRHYLTFCRAKP
jgi:uncharacterized protein (TIGR03067 family)